MGWSTVFNIVAGSVTILAAIFAIYAYMRSEKSKNLAYGVTYPLSIFQLLPDQVGHRIVMRYEKEGAEPVTLKEAHLHFVRLVNLGKDPIRREDLVNSDALRLEIKASKVFDISVVGVTRDVINFNVDSDFAPNEPEVVSKVSFDFLDYKDGAMIRIITESSDTQVVLKGTIIGMSKGIGDLSKGRGLRLWMFLGFVVGFSFAMVLLFTWLRPGMLYEVQGELPVDRVSEPWATIVTLVVLIGGCALGVWMMNILMDADRRLPKSLRIPNWFISKRLFS